MLVPLAVHIWARRKILTIATLRTYSNSITYNSSRCEKSETTKTVAVSMEMSPCIFNALRYTSQTNLRSYSLACCVIHAKIFSTSCFGHMCVRCVLYALLRRDFCLFYSCLRIKSSANVDYFHSISVCVLVVQYKICLLCKKKQQLELTQHTK